MPTDLPTRTTSPTVMAGGVSEYPNSIQIEKHPTEKAIQKHKRPSGAIRERCCDCGGETGGSPVSCPDTGCALWPFRKGRGFRGSGSPMKAIRRYCLWCCLNQHSEVTRCGAETCALWMYRFGIRPVTAIKRGKISA